MTATPPIQIANSASLPDLAWEAEQGGITAPFVAENGIVWQSNLTTNPADGGRALYRFTIQDTGEYTVKATVNATDAGSNSFFVSMDSEPDTSMIWDIVITNGFEERTVSWRENAAPDANAANPKIFSLASGEHTLIIRGREANTLLDTLEVVRTNTPTIPTVTATLPPAATQISIETATPIPPTMTATPPIQIANTYSLPGLSWEAEQGEITTPFVAVNGVVSQSILTDNPANGGRALYRFIIQDAGDYMVKAIVNAADAGRNSFFVGMDTEPDISMIWDVILTNGFEERIVSWRGNAAPDGNASTPKVFHLSPGEHTLIIRGREMSALLDKVEVAKAPIAQPTNTAVPTVTPLPPQTPTITAPPTTEAPQGPTFQPTNTAIPTVTFEASTSTPIADTSTPLPTETPLPTFTAQPLDAIPPTITNITNQNYIQLQVTFSEDIGVTGSDVSNFRLNGTRGGQVGIDSISYDNNSYTTTLNINGGNPLPPDDYTLLVAGSTSITDLAGNKLDGNADGIGGDDFVHGFSIQAPTAIPTDTPIPASPTPTDTPIPPTATATETPVPTSTSTPELPPTEKPTDQPATETAYDDRDSVFAYSSNWQDVYRKWAYKGSVKETTRDGSSVTLNFTGQSFSILYKSGPEYRTLDVYIDDVLVGNINQRSWRQAFQQRWDYPGQLAPGPHTLKLVFVTPDKRDRTKGSLDAVIVR
jgi:predicted 3-demethylubiquinone-9 3-methyltransferase (glyoxalase superfamily)